ncbi:toll/interleukin-1 receptor domain-containing protein [Streptomyces sp. NBC_00663]|uniref:toll/interleukin-1 receptor domain-containing protein n=1 Tax=Streptomyces sp. NBC_00663 TaxID=2975801 RepID=UPI002E3277E9|nr:toll/interleukin-1 receptor domain-containing protein [Streptomyces sp. NBC_00663]
MAQSPVVFVSHTVRDHRDHDLAHRLAEGLTQRGIRAWIAPDDVSIGADWQEQLVSALLEQCTHFLVILSAASADAEWVRAEIDLARRRRESDPSFTILPLVVGDQRHEFLDRFQRIPYQPDVPAQLALILDALDLPAEPPARVAELTEHFVGRENVFAAFDAFRARHDRGLFTVVGDPGEGKSAICAEFSRRTGCVTHFNLRAEGAHRALGCAVNVRAQLARRLAVTLPGPPAGTAELPGYWTRLLEAAARAGEPLVIAVDALDEVDLSDHPDGTNVLFLPESLPQGVYLLLTRRRSAVPLVNRAPQDTYDLGAHRGESRADVVEYLRNAVTRLDLTPWIVERHGLDKEGFVETLADKSQCNFMYLHYVLPQIADGTYRAVDVTELPEGLQGYYQDHWRRMGMQQQPLPRRKIHIVYVMSELSRPVSGTFLADLLREDPTEVQSVLEEWKQFLHVGHAHGGRVYSIYHASFLDFLHDKEIVRAAGESITRINEEIADRLYADLFGADDA